MIAPDQQLSTEDVERIAALHVESIDDSLPTLLGEAFTRSLYRFLERSPSEIVFVERIESRVESVCVVSFEPGSLQKRIVQGMFPILAFRATLAFVSHSPFRSLLWHSIKDAVSSESHQDKAPEITYVFTNRNLRGQSLGRRIVERVDRELAERGLERYFVKTLDEPANRAVQFYSRNGFETLGPRVEGGRTFVEFCKRLAPASASPEREGS